MLRNAFRVASMLAASTAFIGSLGQVKITGADVKQTAGNVVVTIEAIGLAKPKLITGMERYAIYEFAGVLQSRAKTFSVNKHGVGTVKIAQFSMRPPRIRVVASVNATTVASPSETIAGWTIVYSVNNGKTIPAALDQLAMKRAEEALFQEQKQVSTSAISSAPKKPAAKDASKSVNARTAASSDAEAMAKAIEKLAADAALSSTPTTPAAEPPVGTPAGVKNTATVEETPITAIPQIVITKVETIANAVKNEVATSTAKIKADDGKPTQKTTKPDPFGPLPPLEPGGQRTAPGLSAARVNLDFTDADVVAVLKALSIQVNVNIIISPGVTGPAAEAAPKTASALPPVDPGAPEQPQPANAGQAKPRRITLSLKNVTVEEALDLVTALSGLRYAKVGNAYIVTTKDEYADTVRQLADRTVGSNEVRVLPILSGQSLQIKDALYRWFGRGTIEVYLPSEAGQATTTTTATEKPDGSTTTTATTGKTAAPSDPYLVLIGNKKWVDQAETLARQLDLDIIQTQRLKDQIDRQWARERAAMERSGFGGASSKFIYEVQNGKAAELKTAIAASFVDVHIMASPAASQKQVLILEGPEDQVKYATEALAQLDTGTVFGNDVAIYDVKFSDPRSLREELTVQIPGLRCSLAPNHAATPRLFNPGQASAQGTQATQASGNGGAAAGDQAGDAAGARTEVGVKGDKAEVKGLALPFNDMELAAVPMRLILRGTDQQIAEAMAYLARVDVAPRQLALELRVMELSKEDAIKAGIDWNLLTGGAVKLLRLDNSQLTPSNRGSVDIRGGGSVTASLDAIANRNNLIARPNLLAVDGRETEIFVGDVIRYVESITSSQNGPTITAKELRVGVRLAVLPRIGDDGVITMDMRPVVSFLRGFLQPVEGVNLPQTSERVIQTTVNLKSGETIALGGLIQDEDRKQASGIPILMDLPIVGHLFRKTSNQRIRTEVVFFLTVSSLEGPATASNVPLPVKKDGGLPTPGARDGG